MISYKSPTRLDAERREAERIMHKHSLKSREDRKGPSDETPQQVRERCGDKTKGN